MEDFEILTDAEIANQRNAPKNGSALDETDLAGIDAEVVTRRSARDAALRQSVTINPDEAARTKAISDLTGTPPDVVDRNREEASGQARMIQLQGILAASPILSRQMTDPEFAKLAHDDAENLSLFERTFKTYLGASAKSGLYNLIGTTAKVLDTIQPFTLSEQDAAVLFKDRPDELRDFTASSPAMFLTRFSRAMQQASQATMKEINPEAKATYGDLEYATLDPNKAAYLSPIKVVGDAIQSLPTTLALAVSAYLTKGVAARVEAQALEAGMTPELARQAAVHAASETMAKLGAATEGTAGFGQQAIQTREQVADIPEAVLKQSAEYQRLLANGWSPESARLMLSAKTADAAGAAGGAADAVTNYFGGKILGRIIGEGGKFLKRVAKGAATEAVTEAAQSGLEQLGQNAAVQNFMNPHQELLDGVAEQIAMGFTVGGVMGGAFGAAVGRKGMAEQTQAQHDALKKLFDLASSDVLRERSPADFAKFVQATADEAGTSAVFVDAKIFAQAAQEKGLDIEASMPETGKQLREALATGGDLRIPLGEATSVLPGTGLEKVLLEHMRTSPEAPTLAETKDAKFVEETQRAVAQAMAEHDFTTAQKQSGQVVENELLSQLTAANRFTKDVNSAYARLMSTFYTVQAARLGITPEEMYVKYPLRIEAERVKGDKTLDHERTKFEVWSKGAPVINHNALLDYEGGPAVFRVFHGTTSDFEAFDPALTNPESDLGAAIYATNNPAEVSANYAGIGPDLTSRIEQRAEQIFATMFPENEPRYGTKEYKKGMAAARKKARKELKVEHGGAVMPVYINLQNPAILNPLRRGSAPETYLTAEPVYADPKDPESDIEDFKGTLVDFVENIRKAARKYDHSEPMLAVLDQFQDAFMDGGMGLNDALVLLGKDEHFGYISDDTGRLVNREVVREALELTGFDGILDYTVNHKFGTESEASIKYGKAMKGMDEETVHVIAFKPTQIKSAIGNQGTYDPNDPSILKQEGVASANGQETAEGDLDFTRSATRAGAVVQRTLAGGNAEQGWAEATSIRRADGKPATLYRGAGRALTAEDFAADALGVNTGNPSSGLGVWFTTSAEEAQNWGSVEGFHLDIRNPLIVPVEELPGFDDTAAATAWREGVRAQGHDGLLITAKHLGGRTHLVAFYPGQVVLPEKSFAQDTIDNTTGEVLPNPPFFSALAMQIATAKMNVAPAAQWKTFITGLASKGVKKDEIEMSGVMDWLDANAELNAAPAEPASIFDTPDATVPPLVTANGETLANMFPMEEGTVLEYLEKAITEGRRRPDQMALREPDQPVNYALSDAYLNRGNRDSEAERDRAAMLLHRLRDSNVLVLFEERKQLPAPVEPAAVPAVKKDTRIPKQAVIDYLAKNGVTVKTKILGAPKEEQEDFVGQKPANTLVPKTEGLPPGFTITVADTNLGYSEGTLVVRAPDGATTVVSSGLDDPQAEAILRAQEYDAKRRELPTLPDDYDYVINENGTYTITMSNGDTVDADTRREAMEAINEHYENNEGYQSEPSDQEIQDRAEQMVQESIREIARDYADNSEHANASFNVALRPPTYKVIKVEGSRGIRDMFSGEETREHYRVVGLEFSGLPDDDDHQDTDRGGQLDEFPVDEEEFKGLYDTPSTMVQEPIGPEFPTREAAIAWAEQHVPDARVSPKWILWDSEQSRDADRENEGEFDSFEEANSHADSIRHGRAESEYDYVIENPSDYVDMDDYRSRAERELNRARRDEGPDSWYDNSALRGPRVANWNGNTARVSTKKDELGLQHAESYQSDGGYNYRELVIGIPDIDQYNEHDTTHFGHVFKGRTIAWARVKEHTDSSGNRVLFVEEIQSQRAQAGRDEGFHRTTPVTDEERATQAAAEKVAADARAALMEITVQANDDLGTRHSTSANSIVDISKDIVGYYSNPSEELIAKFKKWGPLVEEKLIAKNAADLKRQEVNRQVEGGSIPRAPYVGETQAWVALTMKRLIRYAVDRGLKRIAWTQGIEQVERYESALRKAVHTLTWEKTDKGIEFKADGNPVKRNRNDTEGATFNEKEIRSVVGAHIAQKVINDPHQAGQVSGEDIRIDDLWPAGFYGNDRGLNANEKPAILTIVANKISKSLGGGDVSTTTIAVKENGKLFNNAPGFDITDKMRATVLRGLPLFQGEGQRGQISFGDNIKDRPSVITLLEHADLSTFLHESGHFYLEVLSDIASQPSAPPEIMGDMQKILDWFGVPDLATWQAMSLEQKRPFHEQFARGFESYLFEGKAPNQELNGLFSRMRAWLLNVYRQISVLNVNLTPEVRGVFDRMLASTDAILEAEAARGYTPLFTSAEEMGATAEEWKSYQEQGMAATQEAIDMLQTRSLRDMKWLSNAKSTILRKLQKSAVAKRKAVQAEVTSEVRSQPVYAALRFLTHGELPDEKRSNEKRALLDSAAGRPNKLSIPDLKEMYGDHPAAPWRYLNTGKYGHLTAADGLDPNMVAELFGFTSGDHLVRSILDSEPETSVIQGMTDQRMLERYGDVSSPEAMENAANEAIHNEARARFIATEVRALSKATGQRKILTAAAKAFAATLIARKRLREISAGRYMAAEARAARNAVTAKSVVEKATEKRNQLVNHYAAKAAFDALDEIEKGVGYLRRVGDSNTVDADYREQINALLDRFDLRPLSNTDARKRASLLEWIEEQQKLGFEPVIDEDLVNEATRLPYKEMTLEEFRGLVDSVKNIEHLGRLKHKLLTLQDQREFAAVVGEAAAAIETNAKRKVKAPLERTKWVKIKSGVTEFFAMHKKFSLMLREMDGHVDNGPLWKLLGRPMNDAGNAETVMREQATKKLRALLKPVLAEGKMSTKRVIPEIGDSLSREGRIMVALNMGNAGNLQRLLDGDGWTLDQATAILNTLTKTEMDFVQGVWDLVNEYKGEIGAQQKRITGVEPEWVEPRPLQTIHGEYKGGYIPAKYDTSRSTRSLSDEAVTGIMDMWRAKRGAAKTRDSFTKERANKVVNRPLRKDFGVITQHLTEVTHRLAWQEYLMDAQRLLRAHKIDAAIREHYGPEVLKAMRDAIEDIATGEIPAQNAFESSVNYIRTGATIAGLGWKLTTALLQPIGITQSMVRIGTRHVAAGLAEWMGDAARMESTAAKIYEKSDMMRLRAKTMQREISEIRNVVEGKNSAITASFFYLITKLQLVADIPTWLGQYHKAVEKGADEKSAVAQADQAVLDAQGGGQIKDLAGIQRGGPMMKLFTNFYSFFNTTYNLTSMAVGRTKWTNPLSVGRLAVDFLLLYSVPAALGTLLKAALHSGDDKKDDSALTRQLIADQLTYLFGTMVGLREIAGAAQTAMGLPGDYQGPASVRVFAELAKLGQQAHQGQVDEALLKAMNNVGGILLHYPAGQINATADGIVTMANGKTSNPGALIVGSNKK